MSECDSQRQHTGRVLGMQVGRRIIGVGNMVALDPPCVLLGGSSLHVKQIYRLCAACTIVRSIQTCIEKSTSTSGCDARWHMTQFCSGSGNQSMIHLPDGTCIRLSKTVQSLGRQHVSVDKRRFTSRKQCEVRTDALFHAIRASCRCFGKKERAGTCARLAFIRR